jgi:hypothetical protein
MAKRKYSMWQPEDMQRALTEFNEKICLNECCRQHGIPRHLFKRHLEGSVQRGVCDRSKKSISNQDTELPE